MSTAEVALYREKAYKGKERKDFIEFVKNISIAQYMATPDTPEMTQLLVDEVEGLFRFFQYKKVCEAVEEALKVIKDPEICMELLHQKGLALIYLGRLSESKRVFENLITVECESWNRDKSTKVKIWSLISLSWVFSRLYEEEAKSEYLEDGQKYASQALELSSEFDSILYARAQRNLGLIYWYQGNFEAALASFNEANDIYNGMNPKLLNNIAATYVNLADINSARKYVDMAENFAEEQNNTFELAHSYFVRGRIEEELLNDYIHAKDYYLIAYDNFVEANAFREVFKMMKRMARLNLKHDEESMTIFENRLELFSGGEVLSEITERREIL